MKTDKVDLALLREENRLNDFTTDLTYTSSTQPGLLYVIVADVVYHQHHKCTVVTSSWLLHEFMPSMSLHSELNNIPFCDQEHRLHYNYTCQTEVYKYIHFRFHKPGP